MSDTELVCWSMRDTGCFYGVMSGTGILCGSLSDKGRFYG